MALAAFLLVSLGLLMVGPDLAERLAVSLHLGPAFTWTWTIARWPVIFVLVVTALGWIYAFAPHVGRPWAWLTPGALAATGLWMAASLGFKWYAGHFGTFQRTYGAIGGVIVALLWLYTSGLAILIGAELNATITQAAPHDSARTSR